MKTESKLFLFLFGFFLVVAAIYTFTSLHWYGHLEPIGMTVFILSALMTGMIYFYLAIEGRRFSKRPEDDLHGDIAQGAGIYGFFPPSSMWPFWCTVVITIMLLGPVFGWWLTIMGAILGVWAVCGWCYEFYVGDYKH